MLGAIIGDIVGSRFEWHNIKTKEFEFFHPKCKMTDDSYMTLAVAKALTNCHGNYENLSEEAVKTMQEIGRNHPRCGFGGHFYGWIFDENPQPYNSWGNGSAMRVSACGFVAKSIEEARELSKKVTEISHNHPEGIKGAEATAVAIFLARSGKSKEEIKEYINKNYYKMDFTLDEIRPAYHFDVSCQGSCPPAFEAFFEAENFEDAIRNAISIGGDSDTLACITGGIAEAYFGIPENIKTTALSYIAKDYQTIIANFENTFQKQ